MPGVMIVWAEDCRFENERHWELALSHSNVNAPGYTLPGSATHLYGICG